VGELLDEFDTRIFNWLKNSLSDIGLYKYNVLPKTTLPSVYNIKDTMPEIYNALVDKPIPFSIFKNKEKKWPLVAIVVYRDGIFNENISEIIERNLYVSVIRINRNINREDLSGVIRKIVNSDRKEPSNLINFTEARIRQDISERLLLTMGKSFKKRFKNFKNYEKLVKNRGDLINSQRNQYAVFNDVSLSELVNINSGDTSLTNEENRYYRKSTVDFVICGMENAIFSIAAIEFDGPTHITDIGKNKDKTKNKIFCLSDILLLRLSGESYIDLNGNPEYDFSLSVLAEYSFCMRGIYVSLLKERRVLKEFISKVNGTIESYAPIIKDVLDNKKSFSFDVNYNTYTLEQGHNLLCNDEYLAKLDESNYDKYIGKLRECIIYSSCMENNIYEEDLRYELDEGLFRDRLEFSHYYVIDLINKVIIKNGFSVVNESLVEMGGRYLGNTIKSKLLSNGINIFYNERKISARIKIQKDGETTDIRTDEYDLSRFLIPDSFDKYQRLAFDSSLYCAILGALFQEVQTVE